MRKPFSVEKLVKDSQGAPDKGVDLSKGKQNLLIPLLALNQAHTPLNTLLGSLHTDLACYSFYQML